jgi:hypothetical protein
MWRSCKLPAMPGRGGRGEGLSVEAGAKYLGEQIALAITPTRVGRRPQFCRIREMLNGLALLSGVRGLGFLMRSTARRGLPSGVSTATG